jgi:hypothetical protein
MTPCAEKYLPRAIAVIGGKHDFYQMRARNRPTTAEY